MSFQTFNRSGSFKSQPLSTDDLARLAPTVFQTTPHSARSERYTFISTREIVDTMIRADFLPVAINVARVRDESQDGFQKHLIRFRPRSAFLNTTALAIGDEFPEVSLLNSHNGTSPAALDAGMFRVACLNGLIVSSTRFGSIKVPHKGDVADAIVDGARKIAGTFDQLTDKVRNWKTIDLAPEEFQAMAESAAMVRFGVDNRADLPVRADQFMRARRVADQRRDLWTSLNVIQEHAVRGGQHTRKVDANNRVRLGTARGIKGIDQNVLINRALWNLAERMAELKGGDAQPLAA